MNRLVRFACARLSRWGALGLVLAASTLATCAEDRQLEARLIWGTNAEKSPDPTHKPVEGELARKLNGVPFKFKHYFEVNRKNFAINDKEYVRVEMSKQCFIEVKDKGDSRVTVKLYGEGKQVNRVDKSLPKGETLAIGGDVKDGSAWLVVVQPVERKK